MSDKYSAPAELPRYPTLIRGAAERASADADDDAAPAMPSVRGAPPPKFPSLVDVALPRAEAVAAANAAEGDGGGGVRAFRRVGSEEIDASIARSRVEPGTGERRAREAGEREWGEADQRELDGLMREGGDADPAWAGRDAALMTRVESDHLVGGGEGGGAHGRGDTLIETDSDAETASVEEVGGAAAVPAGAGAGAAPLAASRAPAAGKAADAADRAGRRALLRGGGAAPANKVLTDSAVAGGDASWIGGGVALTKAQRDEREERVRALEADDHEREMEDEEDDDDEEEEEVEEEEVEDEEVEDEEDSDVPGWAGGRGGAAAAAGVGVVGAGAVAATANAGPRRESLNSAVADEDVPEWVKRSQARRSTEVAAPPAAAAVQEDVPEWVRRSQARRSTDVAAPPAAAGATEESVPEWAERAARRDAEVPAPAAAAAAGEDSVPEWAARATRRSAEMPAEDSLGKRASLTAREEDTPEWVRNRPVLAPAGAAAAGAAAGAAAAADAAPHDAAFSAAGGDAFGTERGHEAPLAPADHRSHSGLVAASADAGTSLEPAAPSAGVYEPVYEPAAPPAYSSMTSQSYSSRTSDGAGAGAGVGVGVGAAAAAGAGAVAGAAAYRSSVASRSYSDLPPVPPAVAPVAPAVAPLAHVAPVAPAVAPLAHVAPVAPAVVPPPFESRSASPRPTGSAGGGTHSGSGEALQSVPVLAATRGSDFVDGEDMDVLSPDADVERRHESLSRADPGKNGAHVNVTRDFGLVGGHAIGVNDACFLDSDTLLTAGADGKVCVWDMEERYVKSEFVPYGGEPVSMLHVLPTDDGSKSATIMTMSEKRLMRIWNTTDDRAVLLRSMQIPPSKNDLLISVPVITAEMRETAAAAIKAASSTEAAASPPKAAAAPAVSAGSPSPAASDGKKAQGSGLFGGGFGLFNRNKVPA